MHFEKDCFFTRSQVISIHHYIVPAISTTCLSSTDSDMTISIIPHTHTLPQHQSSKWSRPKRQINHQWHLKLLTSNINNRSMHCLKKFSQHFIKQKWMFGNTHYDNKSHKWIQMRAPLKLIFENIFVIIYSFIWRFILNV